MNLEFLTDFFVPMIAAICVCIGYVVKTSTDIPNRFIPAINSVVGLILALWMHGWAVTPEIVLSGVFSGLASTGLYEAFRNTIGGEKW